MSELVHYACYFKLTTKESELYYERGRKRYEPTLRLRELETKPQGCDTALTVNQRREKGHEQPSYANDITITLIHMKT